MSAEDTHLDDRLPFEARLDALTSQPGDVKLSKSSLGWHLIRCEDVMTELAATMERKRGRLPGTGAFGAALGAAAASADPADAAPAKTGTYAMETMGCQMNVADSERMEGQLESMGLVKTDDAKTASVVVVNTCSIRACFFSVRPFPPPPPIVPAASSRGIRLARFASLLSRSRPRQR